MSQVELAPEVNNTKKRPRPEWTEERQKLLVKFLAELMDAALRYGKLGAAVHENERAGWVQGWVDGLKEENFLDPRYSLALQYKISATTWSANVDVLLIAFSLQTIYNLAQYANAQDSDYEFVLSDKSNWKVTVEKLLVACIKWKKFDKRSLHITMLREMTNSGVAAKRFAQTLFLDTNDMPGPDERSAEHFQIVHTTFSGRSFFNLRFAAAHETAMMLINRLPRAPLRDDYSGNQQPERECDSEAEEPQGEDSTVSDQEHESPLVNAPQIITSKLSEYLKPKGSDWIHIVISVSGETGSGKTTSVLLALRHYKFVIFYAISTDLNISGIEEALQKTGIDKSKHVAMAAEHLITNLELLHWKPTRSTQKKVALVIDEVGKYPLFLRAIAKITEVRNGQDLSDKKNTEQDLSTSIKLFQKHFICEDVRLILVGTGTDHAFSVVGSLPSTQAHVSANDFGDVKTWYEKHSTQWQSIKDTLDPLELERGVFSKLLRLSRNPRMAAILSALDPISVYELLSKAQCRGAKRSLLRDHYSYVLWGGLRDIRQYNGMRYLHSLEATTHFSCAFAIACSNENQDGDQSLLKTYINTYGLLRDCTPLVTEKRSAPPPAVAELTEETDDSVETDDSEVTEEFPKVMTHRFGMTPAAVEIGISHFGMSMPNDGWVGFESMICSLLYLHAMGASSAALLGITLSDVVCMHEQLSQDEADPIAPVKTWIRLHAKCARRVVQASLKHQVRSCGEAAAALEALAEAQVNINEARPACIVIARNGDCAPFADVMVGLVADVDGVYNTTHLLLLQLKYYLDSTPFSAHEQWREMFKMGSTDVKAVVADCAAKLEKYGWDDAMARIHVSEHCAEECKKSKFAKPAGREAVFDAICGDPTTSQRELESYEAALQKFTHAGDVSVPALAAKFLNGRGKKTTKLVGRDAEKTALAFGLKKHQAQDAFVTAVHEIVNNGKEIDQQFAEIISKYQSCEMETSLQGAPSRFPQLRKKLKIDRYLVIYRYEEKVHTQRKAEVPSQQNVDFPENVLVINSQNKVAAFYPTGWEKETFQQETSVREVVQEAARETLS
ncbi:Hypothetical protein, putative, partial [Bodo saltans]